jgi:D-sedoheptulose 7-phosphate isomerase
MEASVFSGSYISRLNKLLTSLDYSKIDALTQEFILRNKTGNTVYFLGNGGSAATASHFSCDLGKGCTSPNFKVRTESPMDTVSSMTAYANDDGYDQCLANYLKDRLVPDDLVVLISASGNSSNLVNAAMVAKDKKIKTFGLLGFDGGKLKGLCDDSIIAYTPKGEYGPVEDVHMVLCHLTTNYIQSRFK